MTLSRCCATPAPRAVCHGGAGSFRGDITWTYTTFAGASGAGAFILGIDPGNQYYLVPLGPWEAFAFPTTPGHYSVHPAPAVALETQGSDEIEAAVAHAEADDAEARPYSGGRSLPSEAMISLMWL